VSFSLTILGSSSAVPVSGRSPSAYAVRLHERIFLVDCGEGTQMQLRKFNLSPGKIKHIFISHLHGDHVFGLFGLLSTYKLLDRTAELHIYSNPVLKEILDEHHKYFYQEPFPFPIVFHPFGAGKKQLIFEDDQLEVFTIPLKHSIPTCGFLFREKPLLLNLKKEMIAKYRVPPGEMMNIKRGRDFITPEGEQVENKILTYPPYQPRSIAVCSDTRYTESIIPQIYGADILYHEATYLETMRKRAGETFHSTARQAGMLAKKANVGKLIIGHFSARYKEADPVVAEARKEFPNTFSAEEGDSHKIRQTRTGKEQSSGH
jgi:ribonuclease Z